MGLFVGGKGNCSLYPLRHQEQRNIKMMRWMAENANAVWSSVCLLDTTALTHGQTNKGYSEPNTNML